MKLWRFSAFLLLTAWIAAPLQGQSGALDSMVRAFIQRHRIPSAAIAVARNGRIVKSAGYGIANLELGVPATDSTVYEIGSISKQFAAEAVMLLVEEGKLGLDDPIARYLRVPDAWQPITIRHILTHTSGLKDWDGGPDFSYARGYSAAEYIEMVNRYPLNFQPGERFAYTSAGYPLLGLVVDSVAREPYEVFVRRRIFGAAGVTATRFKHPYDVVPNRAQGYVDTTGTMQLGEPGRPGVIAPSGGIMSTARDMARWMIALDAGKIVKPATLQQMETAIELPGGRTFSGGIGWFLDTFHGHRLLLHNGSTVAGFSSVVYRYPDDHLDVVVLFNVDHFNQVNSLATRVASYFGTPLWTGAFAERPDPEPELNAKVVAMLAAIAERRDSELLSANLRNPGSAPRTNPAFGFTGKVDRLAFLDREDLGAAGIMRFGNRIRSIYRYKLVAGPRVIYYTVEFTTEGKVARFVSEEE